MSSLNDKEYFQLIPTGNGKTLNAFSFVKEMFGFISMPIGEAFKRFRESYRNLTEFSLKVFPSAKLINEQSKRIAEQGSRVFRRFPRLDLVFRERQSNERWRDYQEKVASYEGVIQFVDNEWSPFEHEKTESSQPDISKLAVKDYKQAKILLTKFQEKGENLSSVEIDRLNKLLPVVQAYEESVLDRFSPSDKHLDTLIIVKELMSIREISSNEIRKLLGCSEDSLLNLFQNRRCLEENEARKLSEYFKVSLQSFFTSSDKVHASS